MLVLNRKEGESMTIGDDVKVTLVKASHGKARIGIDAPKSVPIVRDDAKTVKSRDEFRERQAAVMGDLATALTLLSAGVKQKDSLFPETHTTMHVRNSDLEMAEKALNQFEEWVRG